MNALLDVILPVFVLVGCGYVAVGRGWISDDVNTGFLKYTQNFAIPVLLFRATSTVDPGVFVDFRMLGAYYAGAICGFLAGFAGARVLFGRPWEDCVAIGFVGLFSNSVMIGLPVSERAFGTDALAGNYAIIAFNAPVCYAIGITLMEILRARGASGPTLAARVFKAMFSNILIVSIGLGLTVNLLNIPVPAILWDAGSLVAGSGLPLALFSLGGVLVRYRPEGDLRVAIYISAVSLVLHPAITFGLTHLTGVGTDNMRSAVVTAAMSPGVNAYIFANMYGAARRVAASAVLISTAVCIISASIWLSLLP